MLFILLFFKHSEYAANIYWLFTYSFRAALPQWAAQRGQYIRPLTNPITAKLFPKPRWCQDSSFLNTGERFPATAHLTSPATQLCRLLGYWDPSILPSLISASKITGSAVITSTETHSWGTFKNQRLLPSPVHGELAPTKKQDAHPCPFLCMHKGEELFCQ